MCKGLKRTAYIPIRETLILRMYSNNKKYNIITIPFKNTVRNCKNMIKYQSKCVTSSQLISYTKLKLDILIESMEI